MLCYRQNSLGYGRKLLMEATVCFEQENQAIFIKAKQISCNRPLQVLVSLYL